MVFNRPTAPDYQRPPPPPGYPGSRQPRARWLLYLLPVLAIFAGFGSIVWLAYLEGAPASALGDPPLIKAEATEIKLPPEDPGGRQVVERGAVSELLGEPEEDRPTERLRPPPEEPLTRPSPEDLVAAANRLDARVDDPVEDEPPAGADPGTPQPVEAEPAGDVGDDLAEPPAQPSVLAQDDPPADTEAAIQELFRETVPERRRPEVLRPQPARPVATPPAAPPEPRQLARQTEPVEEPQPEPQAQPEPLAQPEPPAEPDLDLAARQSNGAPPPNVIRAQDQRTVTPAVAPANRAPDPADQALLEGPHFRVQLAAVRNEADAQRAWDLFMVDFGEVLTGIQPIFERGETTNGVFYRVQLGPYANLARAEAMCEELKQRNASCFVLRR